MHVRVYLWQNSRVPACLEHWGCSWEQGYTGALLLELRT